MPYKLLPEALEQVKFSNWLLQNGYDYFAVRNESDGHSFHKGNIRKMSGVKSGVPDMWLIAKRGCLLAIELKRPKEMGKRGKLLEKGKVSPEQKEWLEKLNAVDNVGAFVAHGCEQAKDIVLTIESGGSYNDGLIN